MPEHQLRVAHDRGERIIQLVGNAGNQLAKRRHFFRLQHLGLDLPLARHIRIELEPSELVAFRIQHRARESLEHAPRRPHQLQFIVLRFPRAARIGPPRRRKVRRAAEALREQLLQRIHTRRIFNFARAQSEQLPESCVRKTDAAQRIDQQHSHGNRIQQASKFSLQIPRFRLGSLHDRAILDA